MQWMRNDAAGWILIEAVLLACVALAAAAGIGIFMRTALVQEHAGARMEAAFLARAEFSVMEAALDQGTMPVDMTSERTSNDIAYRIVREVTRTGDFYDVRLWISWQMFGHEEEANYVRRLRRHGRTSP